MRFILAKYAKRTTELLSSFGTARHIHIIRYGHHHYVLSTFLESRREGCSWKFAAASTKQRVVVRCDRTWVRRLPEAARRLPILISFSCFQCLFTSNNKTINRGSEQLSTKLLCSHIAHFPLFSYHGCIQLLPATRTESPVKCLPRANASFSI